jgi:hypothetical protein
MVSSQVLQKGGTREPRSDIPPYPFGVVSLEKNVSRSLRLTLTELVDNLVGLSTLGDTIWGPKPILHNMPGKETALGRCPSLRNHLLKGAGLRPKELRAIGWVMRVNSTNVLDEGLRIGGIGRRMNSKVKISQTRRVSRINVVVNLLTLNLSLTGLSWPLYIGG